MSQPMSFASKVRAKYGDPGNVTPLRVEPMEPQAFDGTITPYAARALQEEVDRVASCFEGGRNHQLNKSAFALAQLIAGGELPEELVHEELTGAALSTGLDLQEIQTTLRSGYAAGAKTPRTAPPAIVYDTPQATTIEAPQVDGEEAGEDVATWAPLDLTAYVDGTYRPILPTVMERNDGSYLLYPWMVHSFQGESESGKSMIAQAETARQIRGGALCLYIDFESDASTVIPRLLMLGATPRDIKENLHYIRPDVNPHAYPVERTAWRQLLEEPYRLVIIDGVTEAFSVYGVKSVDNDEVTTWGRAVPRTIAAKTGAAVVVIDHVTKTTEGRGRFAIGAQAKMSYLTGASYMVEVISPIGVGMAGELALRVGKDRPGMVRPISGEWRKSDRTQETAVITIDSRTPGVIAYSVDKPGEVTVIGTDEETEDKILEVIRDSTAPPSLNKLYAMVTGGEERVKKSRDRLALAGVITVEAGPKNSQLHRLRATSSVVTESA